MAGFSDYLEPELLDHIFGCGTRSFTAPTDLYVSLHTADPGDTGASECPSANAYARVQTDEAVWDAATGTSPCYVDNGTAITFPEATGSWGTVTHFGIWDAASSGNFMGGGSLSASKAIDNGDTPRFPAGDLTIQLD